MVRGTATKVRALFSIGLMPCTFGTAFGFAFGNIGGAMSCEAFGEYYSHPGRATQQLIAAMLPLGAIGGSLIGGAFADIYGRNAASLIASVLFVCGSVVLGLPLGDVRSIAPLLIGRGMIGSGAGIAFMSVPAYVCELSAAAYRGAMASSISLAIAVGFFCSYLCNWVVLTEFDDGWKWSLVFPLLPSLLFLLAATVLPESPRWAILKGNGPSVPIGILQALRTPEDDVTAEVNEILEDIRNVSEGQGGSIFSVKYRAAVVVSIVVMMLQVLTGIDIILVYAPQNFSRIISTHTTTLFWTIFIGGILVLSNLFACFIVDSVGRRPLLLVGSFGMAVSLFLCSLSYRLHFSGKNGEITPGVGYAGMACIVASMAYVMFFSISWGPVAFCIPSELVPSHLRARVVALAAVANWIADYGVVATYLTLIENLGESGAFFIYGILNVIAFVFVFWAVPETKDLSLEDASKSLLSRSIKENLDNAQYLESGPKGGRYKPPSSRDHSKEESRCLLK